MKNKYKFNENFIFEISIYEIININKSIKDKKFKSVNKEILKKKKAFNTKFK